ncbi:class I SAM-dependent methyltransferase [Patescibacteria group bacterium]|nr:class I SAM-dependent methyltransferase [Patescibacteria group bacterium]
MNFKKLHLNKFEKKDNIIDQDHDLKKAAKTDKEKTEENSEIFISDTDKFYKNRESCEVTGRDFNFYRHMIYPGLSDEEIHKTLKDGVIDIGCGASTFGVEAKEKFPDIKNIVSIDVQDFDKIIHEREKRQKTSSKEGYVQTTALSLPFKDNSFGEVITNFGPLYYVYNNYIFNSGGNDKLELLVVARNGLHILYEMLRVVKCGGKVRICPVFQYDKSKEPIPFDYSDNIDQFFREYFYNTLEKCNIPKPKFQEFTGEPRKETFPDSVFSMVITKPDNIENNGNEKKNDFLKPFKDVLNDLNKEINKFYKFKKEIDELRNKRHELGQAFDELEEPYLYPHGSYKNCPDDIKMKIQKIKTEYYELEKEILEKEKIFKNMT